MASQEPPGALSRRMAPTPADPSNAGTLPMDALYEVLLHLPAKELCRLRTICKPWRVLLSEPQFAVAHAARCPDPLLIASYKDNTDHVSLVCIMDMSGHILKRVGGKEGDVVMSMSFDLVYVKTIDSGSIRLLNPATRAVYHLPHKLAEEHMTRGFKLDDYGEPVYLFGQVASTGGYKVLRMLPYRRRDNRKDLFEICTINCGSCVQWRGRQGPPKAFVWNEWTRVVIGGVVYFLTVDAYFAVLNSRGTEQSWIVSFDLEAEEWRPSIKGPSSLVEDERLNGYRGSSSKQLTLANLNSFLVIVHGPTPYMDLWFLMDSDKGLWIKNLSVQIERYEHILPIHPLALLDDGKIVMRCMDMLQIHDPRTNTFSNLMKLSPFSGISIYTGNLLSVTGVNY
ncbi:hypothetical protein EJB05_14859 [Eragrostis curvula]|uniref:F-box domain-containing protein n=1 Tax=Eragrostis curvula TaxID=38414 RepID=A0A5J9VY29_9POAL|nr:hypothetical protein EJB05_14859 [Eragrostis curvula]